MTKSMEKSNRVKCKGAFPLPAFYLTCWLRTTWNRLYTHAQARTHTHTNTHTHTHTCVLHIVHLCSYICAYQNSWQYLISSWAFTHTRSNMYMIRNIHFHICVYIDMVAVFRSSRSAHTAPAHSHAHDAKGKNSRKKFPKVKSQLNLPNQHD